MSRYQMLSEIGSGGMGRVYAGVDRELKRAVAIKVLQESLSNDVQAVSRFRHEAENLAQIKHDNIVQIYDRIELGNQLAIVMELVEGQSLAKLVAKSRKKSRALPPQQALAYAVQIASALDAAHKKGFVHRDIKPGNVMVTDAGRVKVLDFGLAKNIRPIERVMGGPTPSTDVILTAPGGVVGTPEYLAPERWQGNPATFASDQFSFAVLFFETVIGCLPFRGTGKEFVRAVLNAPPVWPSWIKNALPGLVSAIDKALSKDPGDRYPSIAAFRAALEQSLAPRAGGTTPRAFLTAGWRMAAAVAVVASAAGVSLFLSGSPAVKNFDDKKGPAVYAGRTVELVGRALDSPSTAPDNKFLVLTSHESGSAHIVRQVSGARGAIDLTPDLKCPSIHSALSPDGDSIIFDCGSEGLFSIQSNGGRAAKLMPDGTNPSLSPDGKELAFSNAKGLWRWHSWAPWPWLIHAGTVLQSAWSPSGKRIAFVEVRGAQHDIWTVAADGGEAVRVTDDAAINVQPQWYQGAEHLYLIYLSTHNTGKRAIWAVPIAEETGRLEGSKREILHSDRDIESFAAARNGTIHTIEKSATSTIERVKLSVGEHSLAVGKEPRRVGPQREMPSADVDFSPKANAAVYSSVDKKLTVLNMLTDSSRGLTHDDSQDQHPRFSPDGRIIAYDSTGHDAASQIYVIDAAGSSRQQLTWIQGGASSPVWSPDGEKLVVARPNQPPEIIDRKSKWADQRPVELPRFDDEPGCVFRASSWEGNRIAGHALCPGGVINGIRIFDLATFAYTSLTNFGSAPKILPQVVLFMGKGTLSWVPTGMNSEVHELLPIDADGIGQEWVSPEGRELFYSKISLRSIMYCPLPLPALLAVSELHFEGKMILPR